MSVGNIMWVLIALELLGMYVRTYACPHTHCSCNLVLCLDSARYPSEETDGKVQSTRSSEEVQKRSAISFSYAVH